MALTYAFALTGNKVTITETDSLANVRKYSYSSDYNVIPSNKSGYLLITKNANISGVDNNTFEIPVANITGNATPNDVNATIIWITTDYFKGLSVADVTVDTVTVDITRNNKETVINESTDGVKTFTYYGGVEAGNPSGNKNVKTIVYSSALLSISATETFTYDAADDVLTITLS